MAFTVDELITFYVHTKVKCAISYLSVYLGSQLVLPKMKLAEEKVRTF